MSFSVAHVSTTVPSLVLFYFTSTLQSAQFEYSCRCNRTLQVEMTNFFNGELITRSCATGHVGTPTQYTTNNLEHSVYSSYASHVTFPTVYMYVQLDTLLPYILLAKVFADEKYCTTTLTHFSLLCRCVYYVTNNFVVY